MKIGDSSFKQRMALGVVCVLIFAYTLFHMTSLFGETLSTYAAGVTTEATVLNYSGYVFRDETVLTSPYGGVVDYHVEDGTKVSEGQSLATVYENGENEDREEMRRLNAQIAVLEQSTGDALKGLDMGELKQSVSDTYYTLVNMLASGETGGLDYQTDKLLVGMNQMKGVADESAAPGTETLAELQQRREALLSESGLGQNYTASRSGYFYADVDGYESSFTMSAAESLTASSFYRLLSDIPELEVDEKAYGKICYSSEWMLVLPIKLSEQHYFEAGQTYVGTFEENNGAEIPLTLERIIESPEEGNALLVFRADRLPGHFTFSRCQNVRLEVDSVSGIYVPKNVVQRMNGFRGVYILRGSVIHFRYIEIVYEGSDYYLVKEGIEDDEDRTYLKVNDLIILNGKNLFDGMVLD